MQRGSGVGARSELRAAIGGPSEARSRVGFEADRTIGVLGVLDLPSLRAPIERVLEKFAPARFELLLVDGPEQISSVLASGAVDLLLFDLVGEIAARRARCDLAHGFAASRPVVLLTGADSLASELDPGAASGLHRRLESAELPQLLVRTLRRAQRLGSMAVPPVYCRLDHPGA